MIPVHKVSVAALVLNDRNQVLLVNSPWRGWEYPGGLIESGETFEEALRREIREEAGVEVEILRFVGICKNLEKDIVNIDFVCRYKGGALTTIEESTEVIWAEPDEALEMITFPLTKKRLENMLSGSRDVCLFGFRREPFAVEEELRLPVGDERSEKP